jgi:hypothetical protein
MIKRIYIYIFSTLLIALYLLSYVGFAVHKCSCEGSTSISLLVGNPSCEHLHAHISLYDNSQCDEHIHHCAHNHHDKCCTTEVLVLTSDQDTPESVDFVIPAESPLFSSLFVNSFLLFSGEQYSELLCCLRDSPPLYGQISTLSVYSQWRL